MKKEKLNIEEEFVNQSWQAMAVLLDQEMPVEKKKKRGFLWLFGLAIGLVILLVWNSSTKKENSPIESFPILEKEKLVVNKEIKSIEDPINSSVKHSSEKINSNESTKSPDRNPVINPIKRLTPTSSSAAVKKDIAADAIFIEKKESIEEITSAEINQQNTNPEITTPDLIKGNLNFSNKEIAVQNKISEFNNLPILTADLLNLPERITPKNIPLVKNRLAGKWALGFYYGLLAPKVGSFRTGIHWKYQFHPRWSIHSGLGYSKRKWNDRENMEDEAIIDMNIGLPTPEADMDMDPGNQPNPAGSSGFFDPDTNNNSTLLNEELTFSNFHYFDLPVFVQYKMTPRWSLTIGGQISRLYGFHYTKQNDTAFLNGSSFMQPDLNVRTADNFDANFNTWQYSVNGGTSFFILPKLEIYGNYHLGLNKQTSQGVNPYKWKQGEVGIRVFLGKG